ncbi:MAG: hypothetical protein ACRBB2_05045 [Nitrosopumilus sp.]
MFNQQNVPTDKSKKPIYLYAVLGIVSFTIVISSIILYYNSEQEPSIVAEDRSIPEEPQPELPKIDTSDVESLRELSNGELIFLWE